RKLGQRRWAGRLGAIIHHGARPLEQVDAAVRVAYALVPQSGACQTGLPLQDLLGEGPRPRLVLLLEARCELGCRLGQGVTYVGPQLAGVARVIEEACASGPRALEKDPMRHVVDRATDADLPGVEL